MRENIRALGVLMKREVRMLAERRIYWFVMIFAPLFCFLFFGVVLTGSFCFRLLLRLFFLYLPHRLCSPGCSSLRPLLSLQSAGMSCPQKNKNAAALSALG